MRIIVSAALLLILLSSCSKSDQTPSVLRNGCKLLGPVDAAQFLESSPEPGRERSTGEQGGRPFVTQCEYHTGNGTVPYRSIGVLVRLAAPGEQAEGAAERHAASLTHEIGAMQLEQLPGIGSGALWAPGSKQLTFFLGADMVILTANTPDGDGGRARLIKLTEMLLAKLQRLREAGAA